MWKKTKNLGGIMNKKQKVCISLLSVHSIILCCSIINIIVCFIAQKLFAFPFAYSFFNIPFYRYLHNGGIIQLLVLIVFVILSVFLTIMEFKEIINQKRLIFIFFNCCWIWSCCWYSNFINMTELETFYSIHSQLFLGISMLIGLVSLTAISVIQTLSMVKHRTEEDLEKSKYINKNKLIIIFIGLFVFALITEYFMYYNEVFRDSNIPRGLFQGINIILFLKNLAYVLGIYLGVGSILQSVKRICKLKKANFLNGNEQIAMFRNDRNKKIIALAVFILSYFVFYLFK